jgi:hypothetical protein
MCCSDAPPPEAPRRFRGGYSRAEMEAYYRETVAERPISRVRYSACPGVATM